jgi:hypothetical protein
MSVEAISWALNLAPVPADSNGQPSSPCKFVLVGLANHAGPDGIGAFPSVATLVRYTGLSERTVRTCLDRLEADGVIRPCHPAIVAARIRRADRRPKGWDLDMTLIRGDLTDTDAAVLERQFPGLSGRLAAADRQAPDRVCDGVQAPHPAPGSRVVVDNSALGVQRMHPADPTGCSLRSNGVQLTQPRGAAAAPEPSFEPPSEPSAAAAREPTSDVPGGALAGEFFTGLGTGWNLTAAQQARLAPLVGAAIASGWTPAALAAFTGVNTAGVRSPYAVLAARLSPAELPAPPYRGPARPCWCGACDERTRRRQDPDGADAGRCPACHPLAATTTPDAAAESRGGSGRPARTAA